MIRDSHHQSIPLCFEEKMQRDAELQELVQQVGAVWMAAFKQARAHQHSARVRCELHLRRARVNSGGGAAV